MMEIVDQSVALGEEMAYHLIVALMLCSLPESYAELITALESRAEADLTLELVKGKLLQEIKRIQDAHKGVNPSMETVMKTKHAVGQQHKGKVCFYYNKPGHFKRDCTLWLSKKKSNQKGHTANRTTDEAGTSQARTDLLCFKVKENEQKKAGM